MLPAGHIAGGYLAALAAAEVLGSKFPGLKEPSMIAFGTFMGFAPDLDMFYAFSKARRMYSYEEASAKNHRQYISHAPLLYLTISLLAYTIGHLWGQIGLQMAAAMFFFGSWSHFFLDSFGYGVAWLYPFSDELFSFIRKGEKINAQGSNFLDYWTDFVRKYLKEPASRLEILIIVTAVIVYLIK